MKMRRKELAITEPEEIDAVINGCDIFRLAFADGNVPYVVPLNFGYVHEGDVQKFYFHSAAQGRKVDLCRKLRRAAFELDRNTQLRPADQACNYSMAYESVVGEGTVTEIQTNEEKQAALNVLMRRYSGHDKWEMPSAVLARTCVFCLTVTEISGKRHG